MMQNFRISERCNWVGIPDVSKHRTAFIFRVRQSKNWLHISWPLRWRQYDVSKRREIFTERNRVTSHRTWNFKYKQIWKQACGVSKSDKGNASQDTLIYQDLCMISGFRRDVEEICVLLGYHAALIGSSVPTFRDNLSVRSLRLKKLKDSWALKMRSIGSPETSVHKYHSTLRNIPEE
jgi:hypothetical protein